MGELDDRADDVARLRVDLDLVDEGLVDLQCIEGKLLQRVEGRIAHPEIIDGGRHPQGFDFGDELIEEGRVSGREGFGDLDVDPFAVNPITLRRVLEEIHQPIVIDRAPREVDGHPNQRLVIGFPPGDVANRVLIDVMVEIDDEAAFLGEGDEEAGRQ